MGRGGWKQRRKPKPTQCSHCGLAAPGVVVVTLGGSTICEGCIAKAAAALSECRAAISPADSPPQLPPGSAPA
jgi:hypothetical protein